MKSVSLLIKKIVSNVFFKNKRINQNYNKIIEWFFFYNICCELFLQYSSYGALRYKYERKKKEKEIQFC